MNFERPYKNLSYTELCERVDAISYELYEFGFDQDTIKYFREKSGTEFMNRNDKVALQLRDKADNLEKEIEVYTKDIMPLKINERLALQKELRLRQTV